MSGHRKFSELREALEKRLGRSIKNRSLPEYLQDSGYTSEDIYGQLTYVQAHCDSRVLHSPGSCDYCDRHPTAQRRRQIMGVNFTGEHKEGYLPCPAEAARGIDSINGWRGNQPHGSGVPEDLQRHLKEIERPASKMMYGWGEHDRQDCEDPECIEHPGYNWCGPCFGWIDGQPCD